MSGPKQSQENKRAQKQQPITELPPIPDKLYFTIGEVSKLCDLRSHVLRYWEQEFPQLAPSKRRGNRRYYQRKDVLLIRQIRSLLYDQGYTIEGARSQLIGSGGETSKTAHHTYHSLKETINDLENVLLELEG